MTVLGGCNRKEVWVAAIYLLRLLLLLLLLLLLSLQRNEAECKLGMSLFPEQFHGCKRHCCSSSSIGSGVLSQHTSRTIAAC